MIPISLKFRGLTRFRRGVEIDFAAMPEGLIAVAGGNGEGKTTILEAMIVAIFGTFPTRPGAVYDYLSPPKDGEVPREMGESGRTRKPADAVVDLVVDLDGHRWRFLRKFDQGGREQTCHVWIDDEIHGEGKSSEADQLVADRWPPLSQLLASVFAAQGGEGSFLSLKPAQRKDLIVRLLGLERLQELATAADKAASSCAVQRDKAAEAVERAAEAEVRLQAARDTLTRTRQALEVAANEQADTGAEQAATQAKLAEAREDWQAAKRSSDAEGIRAAETADVARLATAELAIAEADTLAARAAAKDLAGLRAAAEPVERLRTAIAAAENAHRDAQAAVAAARQTADHCRQRLASAAAELARVDRESERIPPADLARLRDQVAVAMEAESEIAAAAVTTPALRQRVAGLRKGAAEEQATAKEIEVAERGAKLLVDVSCMGRVLLATDGALASAVDVDCSACPLLVDAARAKDSLDDLRSDAEWTRGAGVTLAEAELELAEAERVAKQAHEKARSSRGAAERLQAAEADARRVVELRADREIAVAAHSAAVEAMGAADADLIDTSAAALEMAPDRAPLDIAEDAARRLAARAELAGALAAREAAEARALVASTTATTTATATQERFVELRAATARLEGALHHHEVRARLAAEADRAAARVLQEASAANARAGGAVEALEDADGKLEDTRAALLLADQEAEDAAVLAWTLGRDGVQAMELDAVGPAVSSIATEILRVVYGPRFVVQFVTQALKAGTAGRRGETKEVFDVRVIDDVRGTDGPAERLSGGEQVVISEALKLALAIFAAQSGSTKLRTLVRDESDGALDDELAANYPAMLRRAQELGGFRRVLLVSHRPSNVACCDAVLRVQDGEAVLEV